MHDEGSRERLGRTPQDLFFLERALNPGGRTGSLETRSVTSDGHRKKFGEVSVMVIGYGGLAPYALVTPSE